MPKGYPKAKASQTATANGQTISKMEAMRQVLDAYGTKIKPLEIKDHLKKQFSIDMDTKVISSYKTSILSKKKGKKGKKVRGSQATTPQTSPAAPVSRSGGITLDDIRAVKELADRLGADKLRQLAEVLAK